MQLDNFKTCASSDVAVLTSAQEGLIAAEASSAKPSMSIIIPASNEARHIGPCLLAVFDSRGFAGHLEEHGGTDAQKRGSLEIIVVANGCIDETAALAESYSKFAKQHRWGFKVLDLVEGNKLAALNSGDRIACGAKRVYLDADVVVSPELLYQMWDALDRPEPTYASGRPTIAPGHTWITRAYGRIWAKVPFVTDSVPGCGIFGVNQSGRARWTEFPQIIADDLFVRLSFASHERTAVDAVYQYPLTEGFRKLVRVRRRQDAGVAEVERLYPRMMANEDKPKWGLRRFLLTAISDSVGLLVYAGVSLAVRFPRSTSAKEWSRGR